MDAQTLDSHYHHLHRHPSFICDVAIYSTGRYTNTPRSHNVDDQFGTTGRLRHSVIYPTTLSVIRLMVSRLTVAPYTSAKCAAIGIVASTDGRIGQPVLMRRCRSRLPVPRSSFAGFRFPPETILVAVRWYLRYGLSYRDIEELLAERDIEVDRGTIYRWVQRSPRC
jgi:hypothetical protein